MRRAALWLATLLVGLPTTTYAQTNLHAVIVGDTSDPAISGSVLEDVQGIHRAINLLGSSIGATPTVNVVLGAGLTSDRVARAIRQSGVGPNDVFVFYYAGHGYDDPQSPMPVLDLGGSDINGQRVRDIMSACGARLRLIILDTCNAPRGMVAGRSRTAPQVRALDLDRRYASWRGMLLGYSGEVVMLGAGSGVAIGNDDGGMFTQALREVLLRGEPQAQTWEDLFARADAATRASSPGQEPDSLFALSAVVASGPPVAGMSVRLACDGPLDAWHWLADDSSLVGPLRAGAWRVEPGTSGRSIRLRGYTGGYLAQVGSAVVITPDPAGSLELWPSLARSDGATYWYFATSDDSDSDSDLSYLGCPDDASSHAMIRPNMDDRCMWYYRP